MQRRLTAEPGDQRTPGLQGPVVADLNILRGSVLPPLPLFLQGFEGNPAPRADRSPERSPHVLVGQLLGDLVAGVRGDEERIELVVALVRHAEEVPAINVGRLLGEPLTQRQLRGIVVVLGRFAGAGDAATGVDDGLAGEVIVGPLVRALAGKALLERLQSFVVDLAIPDHCSTTFHESEFLLPN